LSDCPPAAADEVHDDRDHGEDKQQVNEEAAHVQEEESAEPEQNQHNSQNEKHEMTSFLLRFAALDANATSHRRRYSARIRCSVAESFGVRQVLPFESLRDCPFPIRHNKRLAINCLPNIDVVKNSMMLAPFSFRSSGLGG
jgi:hypothetical protein